MTSTKIQYRPDIDGLRALAILPVLLFHARFPGVTGGYVGVDLFFVISGFLITRIIAREIDEHRFSIIRFYERRARRILPALLPVIAVVLVAAAILFLPGDFKGVPPSALAATFFASNILFFSEIGYFQTGADTKPLLHTWSLAIEEQYYIFFPILLILIARFLPRWRKPIVAAIALISFAMAVATQGDGSGFAFYWLPPRAWELFLGGLLALGVFPEVRSPLAREGIAAAGLIAVLAAVTCYDHHTVFPGVTALAPVLGAVAMIHCAPGTATGRLLSWRPFIAIGLISYSLYLWHWPLIVFTEYATGERLTGVTQWAVVAASFALAWLSWRFVEAPFRNSAIMNRRTIFIASGAVMALTAAVCAALLPLGGWPQRFGPDVARMAAATTDFSPYRSRCHDADPANGRPACVLGAPDTPPSAVVWGDSHGVEMAYVLSQMLAQKGEALVERTLSSCPPILGQSFAEAPDCERINRDVMASILADPNIKTVYLAAFWASPAYADPQTLARLDNTIARIIDTGRKVVLIGPVPPNLFDVPRQLQRLARQGKLSEAIGRDRRDIAAAEARIGEVAARWQGHGLEYINPAETLCATGRCILLHDGHPLYFDSHHPSVAGASLILAPLSREHASR